MPRSRPSVYWEALVTGVNLDDLCTWIGEEEENASLITEMYLSVVTKMYLVRDVIVSSFIVDAAHRFVAIQLALREVPPTGLNEEIEGMPRAETEPQGEELDMDALTAGWKSPWFRSYIDRLYANLGSWPKVSESLRATFEKIGIEKHVSIEPGSLSEQRNRWAKKAIGLDGRR